MPAPAKRASDLAGDRPSRSSGGTEEGDGEEPGSESGGSEGAGEAGSGSEPASPSFCCGTNLPRDLCTCFSSFSLSQLESSLSMLGAGRRSVHPSAGFIPMQPRPLPPRWLASAPCRNASSTCSWPLHRCGVRDADDSGDSQMLDERAYGDGLEWGGESHRLTAASSRPSWRTSSLRGASRERERSPDDTTSPDDTSPDDEGSCGPRECQELHAGESSVPAARTT
mmetsp:Transcript_42257/g.137125  ORF Transcript_42257/g.137125 Transcript_42257/m.137125 type:complete len:225 (-) Transcript_42257:679-1353(-)